MKNSDQTEHKSTKESNMQDRLRTISADLRQYVEKRIELVQLEIADRLSLMIARSIHKLLGVAFMVFSYVFFMIALAHYLGPLLGHLSYGYLIVGGFTGLMGITMAAVKPDGLSRRMRQSWFDQVFNVDGTRKNSYSGQTDSHLKKQGKGRSSDVSAENKKSKLK